MSGPHAIATTMEAIRRMLEASYRPDLLESRLDLGFDIYTADKFREPMTAGISLFLYRVHVSATQRRPLVRRPDGSASAAQLPLELHLLLTAWGKDASLQHAILGWAMRTLEDNALLPPALLSGVRPSEPPHVQIPVEIVPGELPNEEMLRLWDTFGAPYRISVPYIARVVRVDPLVAPALGGPVAERHLEFAVPEA